MPQIVGQQCVRCSQSISSILDGDFCQQCGRAVHHRCKQSDSQANAPEHCVACGSVRLAAMPTERAQNYPQESLPVAPDIGAASSPSRVAPQPDRLAEFRRTLAQLTPRVYVTPVLIGINVLVFVLMTVSGVSPMSPTAQEVLPWGADFGPMTLSGEWWRLLTATFVHFGIIHIALNMWVLAAAGPLVERMIGNIGFLLMYVVAGLCGSVASLFWNPMLVSAGASGAIFGIYGALLALLLRHSSSVPKQALAVLRSSGTGFLFYNLLFGLFYPNIDSAAHIGGLAGGFLCGLVLSQPFTLEVLPGRPVRNLLVCLLGLIVVGGGMIIVLARHNELANVQLELERLGSVQKKVLDVYDTAAASAERHELTDAAFADILERDVLTEWRASRERLSAFKHLPEVLQRHVSSLLEYMRLQQEVWELYEQGLREGNEQKKQQSIEKQKLANAQAQRITDAAGK